MLVEFIFSFVSVLQDAIALQESTRYKYTMYTVFYRLFLFAFKSLRYIHVSNKLYVNYI